MKSVGEAMAIGRSFPESLQKALRSLENGLLPWDLIYTNGADSITKDNILNELKKPTSDRILKIAQAIRFKKTTKEIHQACKIDPWFIEQIGLIVTAEKDIKLKGIPTKGLELQKIKSLGFSDKKLSELSGVATAKITERRNKLNIAPNFKRIDTCAGEFKSLTPYMYSTYHTMGLTECEARPSSRKKVIILGGGPNRIGQGIEFDYCCCHACYSLTEQGYETIMINCNPETVSTDYDTSDRLYFEPLTYEHVMEIMRVEQENGTLHGVIVQFGGQTPLKLANALEQAGIPILGTSPDAIDLAEDRERFQALVTQLKLKQPHNGLAKSSAEALEIAAGIGFPLVIRPSYVLGGRAMEIVHDQANLERYISEAVVVSGDSPLLVDEYLGHATEIDVDAACDGEDVLIGAIMEHLEEAGIHSGDSTCFIPAQNISEPMLEKIAEQTKIIGLGLKIRGCYNIQFALQGDDLYVLEVNPRSSRTVPFVAKATGLPMARIAANITIGIPLSQQEIPRRTSGQVCVKAPVFPFIKLRGLDPAPGPEMKSTGEVMSIDKDFESAFIKCQMAASNPLPIKGKLFVSVKDSDKAKILPTVRSFAKQGFQIIATSGTASFLKEGGVKVSFVNKVTEGHPHIVDLLEEDKISIVINTTETRKSINDSFSLRRTALNRNVPYFLTVSGARAAINSIKRLKSGNNLIVRPISEYH